MAELRDFFRIRAGAHYYGDMVRALFLVGAVLMAVTLPFFSTQLPVPASIAIFIILIIGTIAGVTNPNQKWVLYTNVSISTVAFITFEYFATITFTNNYLSAFFILNQVLALIFFVAFYYSMKSLRGSLLDKDQQN